MKRNSFIWCKNLIRRNGSWLPVVLVSLASMAAGASAVRAMSSPADSGDEQRTHNSRLRSIESNNEKDVNHGSPRKKKVRIGEFKGVKASSAIEVVFTQGSFTGEAEVCGMPELMDALKLNTDGDVLTVSYAECNISSAGNLVVKISAPELNSLYVSTAASFIVRGALKIKEPLNVTATSAASVSFGEVTGGELNIAASGAASVYALTLDLERVEVSATSASDVKLKGISATSVKASAMSASEIVLSGRCHHAEVKKGSEGSVKTRGLIIEDMPPRKAKEKEGGYMLRRP